jgi:putative addiction module killer protein
MRIEQTDQYRRWMDSLRDIAGRARIQVRIQRLVEGNPGLHRVLSKGLSELKIDVGPGYRVYYAKPGNCLLLLLAGGDKTTQRSDIALAYRLLKNYAE